MEESSKVKQIRLREKGRRVGYLMGRSLAH
jgi:hypothetical protein